MTGVFEIIYLSMFAKVNLISESPFETDTQICRPDDQQICSVMAGDIVIIQG